MTTRLCYVYEGAGDFGGARVGAGSFVVLEGDGPLAVEGECGFLFVAGAPIREPVVQHGPFVMASPEQIRECFADYQAGRLMPKRPTVEKLA